jgi:hypothetical protein
MYHSSLRDVVQNMRHHGLTIRNIALFVGVRRSTVHRWLTPRKALCGAKGEGKVVSPVVTDATTYPYDNLTSFDLGAEFSPATVWRTR